jgi:hypothetical protein
LPTKSACDSDTRTSLRGFTDTGSQAIADTCT